MVGHVQKAHAILCSLLSRVSFSRPVFTECIIKRHKLIIAEVQSSSCSLWAIIFPSSYLLEFDDKHWLHHSSLSLSLSRRYLSSLSPSLLVYLYGGWMVVLLSDLSALEGLEPFMCSSVMFCPMCPSLRISLTENKHNKLLK